jgi:protein-disulfide isomerase
VGGCKSDSSYSRRAASLLAVLLAAGLLVGGSSVHAGPGAGQKTAQAASHPKAAAQEALSTPVKVYGSKSAPVTMEIFTDYQCPTCGAFFEQTLRPMINDYVASGKVYVIHHDFPLQMHAYSGQAARWANAAAEVGQFETVEAALYDNQAAWTASGNLEKYVSAAMPSKDFERVKKIMDPCAAPGPVDAPTGIAPSPHPCAIDNYIIQDIQLGMKVPVTGTPTFVFYHKGQKYPATSGMISWPILKTFVDSLLSQ